MAMTKCPNCGEQVSDKAKKCVHCGMVLLPEEKKYCQECGAELDEDAEICSKCGCPVENVDKTEIIPQQVEVTGVKIAKKSKKIIMMVLIVVIAGIAITYGVIQGQKKRAAETAAAEEAKRSEEYSANLELATIAMLSGAGDAETCGNLIKQVWYNAIYQESDSKIDKYTKPKGYYVSDFNDALQNLFSDDSFSSKISGIKENQETVSSLMKQLKNPPDEYEDAYEAISELYDAYLALTNLAIDPSGSLQTFSSNFNDADSEALKCFNAVKMYLEE
ncbi:MAG: zinc-ribbon domain-containing protein [Lachnospiraceae bacterium]